MKRFLRNLPIKQKLMALTMAISGTALLLGCGAFAFLEQAEFRRGMARDFTVLANLFDDNVVAGLAFNDAASLAQTLKAFGDDPRVAAACVYDQQGIVVADYHRPGPAAGEKFAFPAAQPTGQRWGPDRLDTFRDVDLAGEVIGGVYLGTDLGELHARAWRYVVIVGLLLVGCSLVALGLATRLQHFISRPVVDLARTVAAITSQKNYAVRALKESDDELGRLVDGFNEMLAQIQARDTALQRTHEELEVRVAQRTEELAREQARFKFIFDAVPVGISLAATHDPKSYLNNPAHDLITGLSSREASEPGAFERISDPADYRRQMELAQPFIRGEVDHYSVEKRYRHRDGRVVWVVLTSRKFVDAVTGVEQSVTTLVDITERKEAELELRWKSTLLEAQMDSTPDGILVMDNQGRRILQNQLFADLWKIPREIAEDSDTERQLQFVRNQPKDAAKFVEKALHLYAHPDETSRDEIELKDGSVLDRYASPVRGKDGTHYGRIWTVRDITARKRAEAKLAEASSLLEAMLVNSPDTIYFKDTQSRFVLVSRSKVSNALARVPDLRARRTAGGLPADVPEAELLKGLTDFDILRDDDARLACEEEQQIVRTGEAIIGKLEKQTFLDGTVCWSLTSKMPWRDGEGKIVGTFGLSKNITDLKQTEEKLEQVHRQLLETSRQAGMAEVATGVLHNVGNVLNSVNVSATLVAEQMRHSKTANVAKLAALFDQHKADLGGFVTQDTRGRMIPEFLRTLAEDLARENQTMVTELGQLGRNIEHIKEIVAMQQAYARTSGVFETMPVVDILEDALRINAGSLARHHVVTHRDYQARPVVTTDKHKVIQILINLVRNAKYACDETGRPDKQIIVRTTSDDRAVQLAIIDNGIGIPAENLARIFSHGFTTRRDGHGFGLHSGALAARDLGGSLTVHSAGPGCGATFILELPCKSDPLAHENFVR